MYPRTNRGIGATLLPIWKAHFGAQAMLVTPLQILMAVCFVVLLIVCANVANLLLARSIGRQKEFSVRMSLGAGRGRLVRQLLSESLILAAMGVLLGAPLAMYMGRSLGYLLPVTGFPISLETELSANTLIFTVVLCLGACVLSGIAPAFQMSRVDINDVLKEGTRGGSSGTRVRRLRSVLVVSQVALALVAIIGAGLFARSFQLAEQINPGFEAGHVLASRLYLSSAGYSVPDRKLFLQRLRERLEAQTGVLAASYADTIPLGVGGDAWEDLEIEGYVPGPSENMKIYRNVVAPGYLSLLKIPLLDGRDFTEHDDLDTIPAMIVNETFAHRFFGNGIAIGRRVHGWGKWFTVVGVARDSKYHTPNESQKPYFYVAFRQIYREDLPIAFYLRTAGDPNQALSTLRHEVQSIDPNVGVFEARPLIEHISASLYPQKIAAILLGLLGTVALVLAAVGLYGLIAYSMTQRTQEIGIRMALGAAPADVLSLVLRQGMGLTLAGIVAGVVGAAAVTRLASRMLVGVSATDPFIFAGAAIFLALVALLASYVPARRATRIDPNSALRWG